MKARYCFYLILILFAYPLPDASAQVVITRADWDGLIGQTANSTSYSATLGQDAQIIALFGLTGNGQSWDMTGLIYGASPSMGTLEFISPVAGLPGSENPKAQGANYAIRNIGTSGKQGVDLNISFYSVSNTEVKLHGGYSSSPDGIFELFYDQPYTVLPFPYQNGSTWQDNFAWTLLDPPGNFTQADNGVVNGEGTLITPAGTVSVFRSELTSTQSIDGVPFSTITRVRLESQNQNISATLNRFELIGAPFSTYSAFYTTNVPTEGPTDPPADPPGNLGPEDGASVTQTPELSWAPSADANA